MSTTPRIEDLEDTQIEELARDAHYKLRGNLIALRFNPPLETANLEHLNNETAALMRQLDEYHSHLFVRETLAEFKHLSFDRLLNPLNPHRIGDYQEWRLKKLRGGIEALWDNEGPDAEKLREENGPLWKELFGTPLYGGEHFTNHWHITASCKTNTQQDTWFNFGDIHDDLTFSRIIASYRQGMTTHIFFGSGLEVDGQMIYQDLDLPSQPKGMGNNGNPQVAITPDGFVTFDMKK